MQSVIKLTVLKFEGRFCRDRSRQSSAFPPYMEVIGKQKTVA
jgi:hypothetical protein